MNPPFDEQNGLTLSAEWWGAHVRDAEAEEALAAALRQSTRSLYRTASEDGWQFLLFSPPESQKERDALLFDQDGLLVQTAGTVHGPWVISAPPEPELPSTKPVAAQTYAQAANVEPVTAEPIEPSSAGAADPPAPVPSTPASTESETSSTATLERAQDAEKNQPEQPRAQKAAKQRPRARVRPPEGIDFAGLNVELDGDAVWIRLTFPDGEGPATRLHPADTPLGRVIRETIQNKTKEPLTVADDVGIARETQLAMTSKWEDGTPIPPVFTNNFFWKYDHESGVWIKISTEDMKRLVNEAWWRHPCFKAKKDDDDDGPTGKIYPLSLSVGKINNIVEMVALECARHTFFSDRSETRGGVAFKNGYATIENGKVVLLPKSPRNRAEFILPFDYDENLPCPRWLNFLDEAMEPGPKHELSLEERAQEREAKKRLLGEFAGVCLLGNATEHQKCLIMDGRGGNGKSVITSVLQKLFANDSISNVAPQDWPRQFGLGLLVGKRMNIASELPERDMVEGHVFKGVIAGDAMTVENKFEKAFTAKMTAGHLFAANELPHSRDLSDGFWRRFIVLSLDQRFDNRPNVDTKLDQKIVREEIGGVAAWCLRLTAEFEARGGQFTSPKTSVIRKEEWKKQSNPLEQFLEEVVTLPPEGAYMDTFPSIRGSSFYEVYSEWTQKRGHGKLSETKFGSKIKPILDNMSSAKKIESVWKKDRTGVVYHVEISAEWRWVIERLMRNR